MILSLEVTPEEFERIGVANPSELAGRVTHVEVCQQDGLLKFRCPVLAVTPMSGVVASQRGVAEGSGSPISVVIGAKED